MNRRLYVISFILILAAAINAGAQEHVFLIPDRTSIVSGDTIWFNAVVFNQSENNTGKVVHVQLDNLKGTHITKVSLVCNEISGKGYLAIPDSLSTGIYLLNAFTNQQKKETGANVHQRLIAVYNRFEDEISELVFPEFIQQKPEEPTGLSISARKNNLQNTTEIELDVDIDEELRENIAEMTLVARLSDPLSEQFSKGWINGEITKTENSDMAVSEKNGILISGKVFSNTDSTAVEGAIILLSISDEFPYFDYCISDHEGRFFFYIRNAYGNANLVIQELSDKPEKNSIILFDNYIETNTLKSAEKVLANKERDFAEDLVKASYFDRFFRAYNTLSTDSFSIRHEFEYPFYGEATRTFYPELFIDLPDFQEIAREILHGVQFRDKKGEKSIRLLDFGTDGIFTKEPLKLLDGVPVFDPDIFSDMGTTKIKKVDAVFYKRFFGDLSFDGVLAVYSNNPSLSWVEKEDAVHLIPYPCLQPEKNWNFSNKKKPTSTIPDFKKVFFRKKWEEINSNQKIHFSGSDIEGDIVIDVNIVTKDHKIIHYQELLR